MDEFEKCLKDKKILVSPGIEKEVDSEIKTAKNDLKDSKDFLKQRKYKYATIAGYYSLFHVARAMLYFRGLREKSHRCLRHAIEHLFVKEYLIEPENLKFFDDAMGLREAADYEGVFSKAGAKRAIKGAEKFLSAALRILKS